MLKELDSVQLTRDLPEQNLLKGDSGVVVGLNPGGLTVLVEFLDDEGRTLDIIDVAVANLKTYIWRKSA